jgi:hypothetical protein
MVKPRTVSPINLKLEKIISRKVPSIWPVIVFAERKQGEGAVQKFALSTVCYVTQHCMENFDRKEHNQFLIIIL